MPLPDAPAPQTQSAAIADLPAAVRRRRVVSWALWDWGSAAFNAVVTTFVFSTYLASTFFVDPAIVSAAETSGDGTELQAALAANASIVGTALTLAGVVIALLAPVLGQRSDGTGHRKLWLGINTGLVVAAMAAMFFVEGAPGYLVLGATLLAVGNVFFEFASVNYNAMLAQVAERKNMGRVSGFGWGMGYVGGIVLLALLLVLFIGLGSDIGPLGVSEDRGLYIRLAVIAAAIWFGAFALPVLFAVPEAPRTEQRERVGILRSYALLGRLLAGLWRNNRQVLLFLLASAVFRDGLAGVFTFGAIIAAQVFGFSSTEVMFFGIAANIIAGAATIASGPLDDRFGPRRVIMASLVGLVVAGSAVLFIGSSSALFWVFGLALTAFVGPVQSASRSFLARIAPAGREGEIFGLYATSGRAVSFLAPGLFATFVGISGDTRIGILGLVIVLLAGLVLMIPVKDSQTEIS